MEEETKNERFVRLAEARVARALNDIRLIGNLANRGSYEYSPEQARLISAALNEGLRNMEARFDRQLGNDRNFTLRVAS